MKIIECETESHAKQPETPLFTSGMRWIVARDRWKVRGELKDLGLIGSGASQFNDSSRTRPDIECHRERAGKILGQVSLGLQDSRLVIVFSYGRVRSRVIFFRHEPSVPINRQIKLANYLRRVFRKEVRERRESVEGAPVWQIRHASNRKHGDYSHVEIQHRTRTDFTRKHTSM